MNRKWVAIGGAGLLLGAGIAVVSARVTADEKAALRTQRDRVSYGMGATMARNLKRQGADVDLELLVKGFRDGLSGEKLLLGDEDIRQTASAFQKEMAQKKAQASQAAAEVRQKQSQTFFAENAKNEGVVTLPSGLQYKVLKAGDGQRPTDADAVECHYRGSFIDGTEFDSSYARGRPATFSLSRVIPGWREALKHMPVGSRWQIFVPPKLAYGERGLRGKRGRVIGPQEILVFDVDLLGVKPSPALRDAGRKTASASPVPEDEED